MPAGGATEMSVSPQRSFPFTYLQAELLYVTTYYQIDGLVYFILALGRAGENRGSHTVCCTGTKLNRPFWSV
jgi:hypothetical protein